MLRPALLLSLLSVACQRVYLTNITKRDATYVSVGFDSYCTESLRTMRLHRDDLLQNVNEAESAVNATREILKQNRKGFVKIGSRYFYISKIQRTNWHNARHQCLRRKAVLASPKSVTEWAILTSHLTAGKYYWLGISDLAKEAEFISESTGRVEAYTKWWPGEPNNFGGNEHCVALRPDWHFFMNDSSCHLNFKYICEASD